MTENVFDSTVDALQLMIVDEVHKLDPTATLRTDEWKRPGGGGGRTMVLQDGDFLEKGGINTSDVYGDVPEVLADRTDARGRTFRDNGRTFRDNGRTFRAKGLSIVLHPRHPFVPTVHMNIRRFDVFDADGIRVDRWYGGGIDLTPWYVFDDDVNHFHGVLRRMCDDTHPAFYRRFSEWCDVYFTNVHRGESRGLGGIFFDELREEETTNIEGFVLSTGHAFLPSWLPLAQRRRNMAYSDHHTLWQERRRSRYAEFNLLYDRGTVFGLRTGGRIESILMSLPPRVRWDYDVQPDPGSEEERLVKILQERARMPV